MGGEELGGGAVNRLWGLKSLSRKGYVQKRNVQERNEQEMRSKANWLRCLKSSQSRKSRGGGV